MDLIKKNKIEELEAKLAKLEGKRLSVYLFSILLTLGALGLFILSSYVYSKFYVPDTNIFDYSLFNRVWAPMFIGIVIGLKLVFEAFKNVTVFLAKINTIKKERNTLKIS